MKLEQALLSILISLFVTGCFYNTSIIKPLEPPKPKALKEVKTTEYIIDSIEQYSDSQQASLGENLFVSFQQKRKIVSKEVILQSSPLEASFPLNGNWIAKHKFKEGVEEYPIYTNASFYRGAIGVILDENYRLMTQAPLIQVAGNKAGRRWRLPEGQQFFGVIENESKEALQSPWALRYGGLADNYYTFEITNQTDSTVIEVLQTIRISKKDFLGGFTVRGVFIKGLEHDSNGVIKYIVVGRR